MMTADVPRYALIAVADNDKYNVGEDGRQKSCIARGELMIQVHHNETANERLSTYTATWDPAVSVIYGTLSMGGRGMELSTLQYWKEKLYACDDRTGVLYEIITLPGATPKAVPRFILSDGDGNVVRGMRCEWSTVKGDYLVMGSTGKPWTGPTLQIEHLNTLWTKMISPYGEIKSYLWQEHYAKVASALGINMNDDRTGYVVHECAMWSSIRHQWFFIPRHVSKVKFDSDDRVNRGAKVIVAADAEFSVIHVTEIKDDTWLPSTGVTECKFVPNGKDFEIVIIKVVEKGDQFISTIGIVSIEGQVLMRDMPMPSGWKFEGLELKPIVLRET